MRDWCIWLVDLFEYKINPFTVVDSLDSISPVNINYWISSCSTYHVHRLWKNDTSQSRFSKRQIRSLRKCLQIMEFAHSDVITLYSSKQRKLSAWGAILHNSFQLFFFYSHGYPRVYPLQWSRYRMEENCPILMSKRNAIFSVSPPYSSFLPINTWQWGDEKSRIKTNEFRFRRAS